MVHSPAQLEGIRVPGVGKPAVDRSEEFIVVEDTIPTIHGHFMEPALPCPQIALPEQTVMGEQAKKLQLMDKLVEQSTFTEDDVAELDHKIKEGLVKRFSVRD